MKRALAFLLLTTGCQSIAGIEDVTLADASASDINVSDTNVSDTPTDTMIGESPGFEVGPDAGKCASTRGPSMVEITHPGGSFCIDVTEVTSEQYAQYAKAPPTLTLPARCSGVGRVFSASPGDPKGAQYNVNWCDAYAFCAWAGKRLCGPLDSTKPVGSDNSEWTWACTQGGTSKYPYGDTYDAAACIVGRTATTAVPEPVGSAASCKGAAAPYDSLRDMSGNVSEWVDECDGTKCRALGGYFGDTNTNALSCASIDSSTSATVVQEVNAVYTGLGFRCCR